MKRDARSSSCGRQGRKHQEGGRRGRQSRNLSKVYRPLGKIGITRQVRLRGGTEKKDSLRQTRHREEWNMRKIGEAGCDVGWGAGW